MVNQEVLDTTFHALADHTRRAMLAALADGDRTVGDLAAPFQVTLPAVMKHLRVLETAGLVTTQKIGRSRHVRLRAEPLQDARAAITQYERFWNPRLDALADLVEQDAADPPPPEDTP